MSSLAQLVSRLRADASVQPSEGFSDTKLGEWVRAAIQRHVPEYSTEANPTVPSIEDEAIITLAWESLCYSRAAKSVNSTDSRGAGPIGTDRDSPYQRNMDMAAALKKRYDQIVAQTSTSEAGGEIIQGRLVMKSARTDQIEGGPFPRVIVGLQAKNVTTTTCVLVWSAGYTEFFADFLLYAGDDPVLDSDNTDTDDDVPGIADSALLIQKIEDQDANSVLITDLSPGEVSYFVLVLKTRQGRHYYSNEILVINPSS